MLPSRLTGTHRVTEMANELSENVDVADARGIIEVLAQVDEQIFSSFGGFPSLYDHETLHNALLSVSETLRRFCFDTAKRNFVVIFAGCGTSGRLSCLSARLCKDLLQQRCSATTSLNPNVRFRHCIAGGSLALRQSIPNSEDDCHRAVEDLVALLDGNDRLLEDADGPGHISNRKAYEEVLYIGTTCGMSAPYIIRQLQFCVERNCKETCTTESRAKIRPVLMGFNPVLPADHALQGIMDKITVLNPVIGPEVIAGSSRMKGGSTTLLLLHAIFEMALHREEASSPENMRIAGGRQLIKRILQRMERALRETYRHADKIARIVESAGQSLRRLRTIWYVVDGSPAIRFLAQADASECGATFCANSTDIRVRDSAAFLTAAARELEVQDGDTVIVFQVQDGSLSSVARRTDIAPCLTRLRNRAISVFTVCITSGPVQQHLAEWTSSERRDIRDVISIAGLGQSACYLLSCKLILNAISTSAHILKGCVYHNLMINIRISNKKLYHRATHVICTVLGISEAEAEEALLKSLYYTDDLPADIFSWPVGRHVEQGCTRDRVVPLAILVASAAASAGRASPQSSNTSSIVQDCFNRLSRDPVPRRIVEEAKYLHKSSTRG